MMQTTHRRFRSLVPSLALIAAGLLMTTGIAWARPTQPSANDHAITIAVSQLMLRQHLTGQMLDDTISERTLKTFIKDLDPLKLFFYQSDIDEFNRNKDHLDDMLKHGDVSFAYEVFSRFLSRVDERITMAEADLNKPQNFDLDEKMVRDPDAATFAKTPEEAADRWRKRVKYDLLKETADKVPMDEAIKKLTKRYESIRKSWQQTDNDELLERYLTAMTSAFDPHSSYMSPSTLEKFQHSNEARAGRHWRFATGS